ncbi:hypothetical protein NDU88_002199 [Pleurodeles waltl]|uniref:Uncharacterized protein n=1 Tax=Pleurodeles waltl TaxID=8319 RepID=A0AAV7SET9_PLEWA|nr:hypothetical protein NDU88_002199 [Pleurodeles waltl]
MCSRYQRDLESNKNPTNQGEVSRSRRECGSSIRPASGVREREASEETNGGVDEDVLERTGETKEPFVPIGDERTGTTREPYVPSGDDACGRPPPVPSKERRKYAVMFLIEDWRGTALRDCHWSAK